MLVCVSNGNEQLYIHFMKDNKINNIFIYEINITRHSISHHDGSMGRMVYLRRGKLQTPMDIELEPGLGGRDVWMAGTVRLKKKVLLK